MSHDHAWSWELDDAIASETGAGRQLLETVLDQLGQHEWGEHDQFCVHLALEEALINAIRHGNRSDLSKRVFVRCKISTRKFWVEVQDEGPGFDPMDIPDPTEDENIEIPSGRGLMLMRSFMSIVQYNDVGNRVTMIKERSA